MGDKTVTTIQQAAEELAGTFSCPICGRDFPHGHTAEEISAYRKSQTEKGLKSSLDPVSYKIACEIRQLIADRAPENWFTEIGFVIATALAAAEQRGLERAAKFVEDNWVFWTKEKGSHVRAVKDFVNGKTEDNQIALAEAIRSLKPGGTP